MVAVAVAVALLSGCSAETQDEWRNLAMPDPATEQAQHIFELWRWSLGRRAGHRRRSCGA